MNTVRDKLRFMLVGRGDNNRQNINSSEIVKIISLVEQLFDEFLFKVEHC